MNISIGARVGVGFLSMLLLLGLCGYAGIYGVNKVSESLLFVTGPAWSAADSSTNTMTLLQNEMLITERILSREVSSDEGRRLLDDIREQVEISIQGIKDNGLFDDDILAKTDLLIRQYRGNRLSVLSDHQSIREQLDLLTEQTEGVVNQIRQTQEHTVAYQEKNRLNLDAVTAMKATDKQLDRARTSVLLLAHSLQQLFEATDQDTAMKKFNGHRKSLMKSLKAAYKILVRHQLKEDKALLRNSVRALDQLFSQVMVDNISFLEQRSTMRQVGDTLLTQLTALKKRGVATIEGEVSQVSALVTQSNTLIISAAIGGVLAALVALAVIIFTVVYPIRHVARSLQQIGEGESDLNVALKESGATELVVLAKGFNGFVAKIRKTITVVSESVEELSNGANTLKELSLKSAERIQTQTQETEQAAAAVHELTVTAGKVAEHAAEAAEAASQTDKSAAKGKQDVDATSESCHSQIEQLDIASAVIAQLAQDSQNISNVLEVIDSIAEQTNLLALNAAIEAARAGEAGRGFAVVADEVRQLASRTQTATTEIQSVIHKLPVAVNEAVSAMGVSKSVAKTSASQAQKAGESLVDITRESNTISDMNLQIASAAEQQAAAAELITQSVSTISERAKGALKAADLMTTSSEQLTSLSQRLNGIVSSFKY